MLPSRPDRASRMLAERMLITKIITGIGLAFLLILGSWSGSHVDGERGESHVVAAIGSESGSATSSTPLSHTATSADASVEASSIFGALTACLLGIFCTFVLLALVRLFLLRNSPSILTTKHRILPPLAAVARRFVAPPALDELSISRT